MHPWTKYAGVDRYALQHFKGMHDRVRDGKSPSIAWSRDKAGYLAFCSEIGSIPERMAKPSVGRKEHTKGYEPGNVQWEEHAVNSIKRNGTKHKLSTDKEISFKVPSFRKGTPEHREHQRKASNARWSKHKENSNA